MRYSLRLVCTIAFVAASLPTLADQAKPPGWDGSVELGVVVNTGNTDQRSFKFRADSEHDGPRFRHTLHADYFRQSQDSVVNADKFYGSYQADYKLEDPNALFGRYSYENDKFSGYNYQEDLTFGYSRRLFQRPNMQLTGDAGAGARHSKLDSGDTRNEGIVRLALRYKWQISDSSVFKQSLSAELGQNNILRSETSLQSTIAGNLAMKLAVNVKHQSDVPLGFKQTDTESSITLVYNF